MKTEWCRVQIVLSGFVIFLRALTVDRDQDLISHIPQMKRPQPFDITAEGGCMRAINTDLL